MNELRSLRGTHVLLTGATGGVGQALLSELGSRGAKIFATARSQDKLDAAIRRIDQTSPATTVRAVSVDLTSPLNLKGVVNSALEWFDGRIDVLINNAGVGYHCKTSDIIPDEVIEVLTVNAVAPIILTTLALPGLRQSPAPKVVNISSFLGSKALPLTATYTASKHALNGYSKVLRIEEAHANLSVTVIEPGAIDTDFIKRTHDATAVQQFGQRKLRKLTAAEIARWVVIVLESPQFACPELIRICPIEQAI